MSAVLRQWRRALGAIWPGWPGLLLTLWLAAPGWPAQAQAATPNMPALQALFSPMFALPAPAAATANAAAAASGASATPAVASPASAAEIERSLDVVIGTLDNERARNALVAQLKQLRSATARAGPPAAIDPDAGLLSAIGTGFSALARQARSGSSPLHYWQGRLNAAGNELYGFVAGAGETRPSHILVDFVAMLASWGGCAALLILLQRKVQARYHPGVELGPNPSTRQLLVFALRRVVPWTVAFLLALYLSRRFDPALGRTLALVCAYAIVSGAVFSSICLIMFSLFGSGHRRVAVHILLRDARYLLFAIGISGALGDAAVNYDVAHQVGLNLSALISTAANICAAVLTGFFAISFQRPVAHLLRNRSYEQRLRHRASTETFDLIGAWWHIPVLLLAAASVLATVAATDSSEQILRQAIGCAGLLIVTLFLTAVLRHVTQPKPPTIGVKLARRPASAYRPRLLSMLGTLLSLALWVGFLELSARLWDQSLLGLVRDSASGRGIGHAIYGIGLSLLVAWLMWALLDAVLLETLNPTGGRARGRTAPGNRARTIMPLVRNFAMIGILIGATIAVLANLGLNVTPLLAGAGVIGLAVGFGAQSLVQDLITGLFIIFEDTISVGDSIDVDGGHAGTVEGLTIRTVRLRDGQGAIHAIPFSQIKIVKNLSRDFAFAVFEVRVPFSADVEQVTQLIRAVGNELAEDFRYRRDMLGAVEVWGLDRFDPNWMVIKGQIKTRPLQQWSIARAFNLALKDRMDQAGIEIPIPQMRVVVSRRGDSVGEGGATAAERRKEGFAAAVDSNAATSDLFAPDEPTEQAAAGTVRSGGELQVESDLQGAEPSPPGPAPEPTTQTIAVSPQIPIA